VLHGQRIDGKKPYEINRLGLSRSFQITNIFPSSACSRTCAAACCGAWATATPSALSLRPDDANERAESCWR
jgi:branched-chain amino acid transport system ATP-binding protein